MILCWRLAHQIPEVPTVNGWTRVQSGVSDFAWQSAGIKKITGWLAESQLKSGQEDGTSSALGCRLWSTSPMTVNEQEKHALTEAHPSSVGQAGPHRHCCCSFPPGCPLFRFTGGLLVRHHHRHCNAIDARGRSTDFRSSFHWNGCRSRRRRPSRCLFSRQCSCARNSRLCYGCYLCAPSRRAGNLSLCEHHLSNCGSCHAWRKWMVGGSGSLLRGLHRNRRGTGCFRSLARKQERGKSEESTGRTWRHWYRSKSTKTGNLSLSTPMAV